MKENEQEIPIQPVLSQDLEKHPAAPASEDIFSVFEKEGSQLERKPEERWQDTSEARLDDYLTMFFPQMGVDLSKEQLDELQETLSSSQDISTADLVPFVSDPKSRIIMAKDLAIVLGKRVVVENWKERLMSAFVRGTVRETNFTLARTLVWLQKHRGGKPADVLYPASGSDTWSEWLTQIDKASIGKLTCINAPDGGPAQAADIAKQKGVDAANVRKYLAQAVKDGDVPEKSVDVLLLDDHGIGAMMMSVEKGADTNAVLNNMMKEGGLILLSTHTTGARTGLESLGLDPKDYRLLSRGNVLVLERRQSQDGA